MKFSEYRQFFVISNSFIDYLIKNKKNSTAFWSAYKGKIIKVTVEIRRNYE